MAGNVVYSFSANMFATGMVDYEELDFINNKKRGREGPKGRLCGFLPLVIPGCGGSEQYRRLCG